MKNGRTPAACLAAAVAAMAWGAAGQARAQEPASRPAGEHRTDWLYKAKWGVMMHYGPGIRGTAEPDKKGADAAQWRKIVEDFDVEGLAQQIKDFGGGYLMITSRHGDSMPLAPNAVLEKAKGAGYCPTRDLIADLHRALDKRGLHLILYYSTGMTMGAEVTQGSAAVIREWSLRYGPKVKGWWLDNNAEGKEDLQKVIADACRAGNPEACLAFNSKRTPHRNSPYEDFTAGDSNAPGLLGSKSRFIEGGDQYHVLTFLGHCWGGYSIKGPAPRYTPERAASLTTHLLAGGGVITWDVKPTQSGRISEDFIRTLRAIGKAAAETKR